MWTLKRVCYRLGWEVIELGSVLLAWLQGDGTLGDAIVSWWEVVTGRVEAG